MASLKFCPQSLEILRRNDEFVVFQIVGKPKAIEKKKNQFLSSSLT
ncbi:hypothetical protein [Wolbachia endosymbiont (group A) of Anoplius nigerrimus]|nr:hypothetical protein [Wolbachia endosymbiont (group A) of Anoplius nigerrimus]